MAKDTREMTPSEINRELERLRKVSSRITDRMIAEGRGHELPSETLKKSDPLSVQFRETVNRLHELRSEIVARTGQSYSTMPTRRRNPPRKARVTARGRRATARRSRNPLPKGRELRESFTLSTLRAVRQGGRVEKVWYEDARDGKHYYHDFDGEQGAIMYLCESAAVGKCVLIVPGDLSTPLWEDA